MKIEDARMKSKLFKEILPGEIFGMASEVYMKTKPSNGREWAICLEDGDLTDFDGYARVEPLNGKIVLE